MFNQDWGGAVNFDQDISSWDVSNVTDMSYMFTGARNFNQNISTWDVSNVTDMSGMFIFSDVFNQPIGIWDVSNVTDMRDMFRDTREFNQDISSWNVSKVRSMWSMFSRARKFNQDISGWDVANVTVMEEMFLRTDSFNQDLSSWNTEKVITMNSMFREASAFNQNCGNWILKNTVTLDNMFDNSGLDCYNYSATLKGWEANNPTISNKSLGAEGLQYSNSAIDARERLINNQNWQITGDSPSGNDCDEFISHWFFQNPATELQFNAQTSEEVVYAWQTMPSGNSGEGSFTSLTAGSVLLSDLIVEAGDTLILSISPQNLLRFYNDQNSSVENLIDISQWGMVEWSSMDSTFFACSQLTISAKDAPNLGNVTSMVRTFYGASSFNQDVSSWDVSNVTDMTGLFESASTFDQSLSLWNTENVKNMENIFHNADSFNQSVSGWNFSQVTNLSGMFYGATSFNENIGNWILHPDVSMTNMLNNSGLDCDNYTSTLIGWHENNPTVNGRTLGAMNLSYGTAALEAREALITSQGWQIIGDAQINEACGEIVSVNPHLNSKNSSLSIFPNPSFDRITAEASNAEDLDRIQILNAQGNLVSANQILRSTANKAFIDLSNLNPGIYFIRTFKQVAKVIKM